MYSKSDYIFCLFYTLLIHKSWIVDALGVGFCLFFLISEPYCCITYRPWGHQGLPIPCADRLMSQPLSEGWQSCPLGSLQEFSHPLQQVTDPPHNKLMDRRSKKGLTPSKHVSSSGKNMTNFSWVIQGHPFCHMVFHPHFKLSAWVRITAPWCKPLHLVSDWK